jgi:hypothetical protein
MTPQYLKDISDSMGTHLGFSHCPRGYGYPLLRGDTSDCLDVAASGLGESTISVADSELEIKKSSPNKHCGGPD